MSAVGPIMALLQRAEPISLTLWDLNEVTAVQRLEEMQDRWEKAEEPLMAISIGHHDEGVRQLALELHIATRSCLGASARFVQLMATHKSEKDDYDRAVENHEKAALLASTLATALQPRGRGLALRWAERDAKD